MVYLSSSCRIGHSPTAQEYAIQSRDEAVAYLGHPILGARLLQCCDALLKHEGKRVEDIVEYQDNLKLRSSMTLFANISARGIMSHKVLNVFYANRMDRRTIAFLFGTTLERPARGRWRVDFWDIVMNIIQMAGLGGTFMLLKGFTPLPYWACVLIGIPCSLPSSGPRSTFWVADTGEGKDRDNLQLNKSLRLM
jgi:uncharacterized protein (DUF1810 family)